MAAGVLNQEQMLALFDNVIKCTTRPKVEPDPSSIDLPLGDKYYVMTASCRPHQQCAVSDLIRDHSEQEKPLVGETVLEPHKVYLVEAAWGLELSERLCARSTARSSIGRLDVLVRLVTDHADEFDKVAAGKTTPLYVEVVPITFPIVVRPGSVLSQLRFMNGDEDLCTVPREALQCEDKSVLVDEAGKGIPPERVQGDRDAFLLSLNLQPDRLLGFAGFVAKDEGGLPAIDPTVRDTASLNPSTYWEPVRAEGDEQKTVRIQKNRFYIFRSKERFRVPPHLAVDAHAYSESLGDIRIHYAGFAHPFFGLEREQGTPLIFEVRGHSMDTILRDNDRLAKVYIRRMSREAEKGKQEYNNQELSLSGCFRQWNAKTPT
jgi:dCTP deaminase